jgi:hypothetical protein
VFRSLPPLVLLDYFFSVFWAPCQMLCRIVDRMACLLQSHASLYDRMAQWPVWIRELPVFLITLWARRSGKPAGIQQRLS